MAAKRKEDRPRSVVLPCVRVTAERAELYRKAFELMKAHEGLYFNWSDWVRRGLDRWAERVIKSEGRRVD